MALTKVSGDFIQDGSITQSHLHASHGITTSDIGEGSNLYFTTARVDSRIGDLSTSDLSEGTNLYYTDARFNTAFAAKSTSDLSEGTNLYYTDARVGSYLTTNSYATQSYVNTQVSNLVDSAPSTLDTLNELAAALGDDANFSTTVTNSIATKMPLAGGTFTGQVIFPSAATTKPVLPNGFISRNDLDDTSGRHDIWGISERYYPSNSTAGDAWGIQWSGTPNDIVFVGGGTDRFTVSLDEGNITAGGTITASGGNSTQWNTAYGWGNHASAGYLTSYTETDTLATVTARGASTTSNITTGAITANVSGTGVLDIESAGTNAVYIRAGAGDELYIGNDGTYRLRFTGSNILMDNGGYLQSNASLRAPIFYDSNDTNYYLNPASDSRINNINVDGAGAYPLQTSSSQRYMVQVRHTGNSTNANYGWWWFMDPNFNMGFHADGAADRLTLTRDGDLIIGQTSISYTSNDNTPVVGSTTTNRLHVNGSIQLTNNNDAIVFGRGTASFMKDEEIGFGWGGGWYMTDGTYLRVRNNVAVYSTGYIYAGLYYDSDNTSYYVNPSGTTSLNLAGISNLGGRIQVGTFNASQTNSGEAWIGRAHDRAQGVLTVQLGTNTGRKFEVVDYSWTTVEFSADDSGVATAASSFRAPLFYDSNNTNYYVDPQSNTRLNGFVKIGNSSTYNSDDGSWGARLQVVSTIHARIDVGQDANAMRSTWYCHTGQSGSYFGATTGHDQYLMSHNTVRQYLYNGWSQEASSYRAPIFYDSNDTAYYIDPAAQSGATSFYTKGDIEQTNIANSTWPYLFTTSGGSNNNHSGFWTSSSGYPDMRLRRENSAVRALISSWERSYTSFGFTDSTDMRSPIFYDSNNTGYYVNPNGTSNVNVINADGECNFTKSTYPIFVYGNGSTAGSSAVGLQVYSSGGNGAIMAFHRGGHYAVNMGLDSDNVIRIGGWSASSNRWQLDMSGNTYAAGSHRAPIFYDLNNTGYYVDPASWSNLSSGRFESYLQIGTTGITSHTPGINMAIGSDIYWRQSTYSSNADVWMESVDNATYLQWKLRVSSFDTTSWTDSIVVFNHNFWRGYVGILRSPEYPLDLNGQARLSGGYTTSDVRLKRNIRDNELGLSHLLQLRTRLFDWITDEEILGRTLAFQNSLLDCRGFIAQEVEEVVPELVDTSEGDQPTKSIDDGAVTAMMVKAIQEQQAIIDDLKARIEILENQ